MAFPKNNNLRDKAMMAKSKKPPVGKMKKGAGAKGMMAKLNLC